MTEFERFNTIFPNSVYRLIKAGDKTPEGIQKYPYKTLYVGPNQRVGWIVSEGHCVVDCDDMTTANAVRKYVELNDIHCCYFKTSRGMHFIFRLPAEVRIARTITNSSHVVTMSSLEVDYRVDGRGYIVLPLNDPDREWTHLDEQIDYLPIPLYPFGQAGSINLDDVNLMGLGEGDGRNDALFRWINRVKSKTNDVKSLSAIGQMINECLFAKPLSNAELNSTVLRESNLTAPNTGAKRKTLAEQEVDVARQMLLDKQFYSDEKRLYVFDGRYYKPIADRFIEREISVEYAPQFRSTSREEVYKHLLTKAPLVEDEMNDAWHFISFNNCVLDIKTGETFPHSQQLFVSTHINHNYIENAPPTAIMNAFLDMCSNNDVQKRAIILEMIGDCLLKRALFQKMYLIYGEGGTGKSTLLRIITSLVGEENASFLSLQDLENTFYPWELVGKLVNIGDDIPFGKINDSSLIKKLVSGERMMIQRKFGHPASFSNYATMIFTTNKLPNTADRTSGFMRRLVLIDMNTKIQKPTTFFCDKLSEADFEYLIYLAASAIRAALERGELTRSFVVDNNLQAYQRMQSALSEYIDDENITRDSLIGRDVGSVFAEYALYCQLNGMRPIGKHSFVSELCSLLFITSAKLPDDAGQNIVLRFTYVDNKTN